jgi:hypothetical protein
MLKSLEVRSFTAFGKAELEFANALNVFVGENGTGKTHLLKLPYTVMATSADGGKRGDGTKPTKGPLQRDIAQKLMQVFRPESLGRLIRGVAEALVGICSQGIPVFVATHSLFLLRELKMLLEQHPCKGIKQRYFALAPGDDGVTIQQGDRIDDVDPLVALDEELQQSDRFLDKSTALQQVAGGVASGATTKKNEASTKGSFSSG